MARWGWSSLGNNKKEKPRWASQLRSCRFCICSSKTHFWTMRLQKISTFGLYPCHSGNFHLTQSSMGWTLGLPGVLLQNTQNHLPLTKMAGDTSIPPMLRELPVSKHYIKATGLIVHHRLCPDRKYWQMWRKTSGGPFKSFISAGVALESMFWVFVRSLVQTPTPKMKK